MPQKQRTLSQRLCVATQAFLKNLTDDDEEVKLPKSPGKIPETGTEIPCLHYAVADLQEDRTESFTSIVLKHLAGKEPLGRGEYLFLVYEIQRASYSGNSICRQRFIELVQLHRELYRLFHSRFNDDRYLLGNLNAYAARVGINNDVSAALEKMLAMAERAPEKHRFNPDLVTRNLAALLRESEKVGEVAFSSTLSAYDETVVTLAARGVFEAGRGCAERFEEYLEEPVSITEKGTRYRLQVISNSSNFWAVLELNNIVMPLEYRQFCALSALEVPERTAPSGEEDPLMLRLPHGYRLVLSREEAKSLKEACARIRKDPGYRSHDRIWSVLHGMWE
ncbi:MAG: hypothetical protein A2075_12520 [Geobacteraceae bacterium GWC2_58_44]|nr:MAG: hypothetical protein A2075_12520 [Geobacteraceae bacterium GWC2_58_44]HBG06915.1 hypothetical protein [Geobacter sp.]